MRAEQARVPQASALPEPMLQVGVQNDGFTRWEVGSMATSYVSIMASQTIPWPGKLRLRAQLAESSVGLRQRELDRLRRSTEAEVRRRYVALLLARDRLALLDRLLRLWEAATESARAAYQAGGGSQLELIRSQLETSRLVQRRVALEAEAQTLVQELNRLRGAELDEGIATTDHLVDVAPPPRPTATAEDRPPSSSSDERAALEEALASSPELAGARVSVAAAGRALLLAKEDAFPDVTVSAGIMLRGAAFPPMWLVTLGGTVPVWAGSKQRRAVEEGEARATASRSASEALELLLRLRVRERHTARASLAERVRLYRDELLPRSRSAAESALTQYRLGRAGFASVVEANLGLLADEDASLQVLFDVHTLAIADLELSLEPVTIGGGDAMASAGRAGMGASATSSSRAPTTSSGRAMPGGEPPMSSPP